MQATMMVKTFGSVFRSASLWKVAGSMNDRPRLEFVISRNLRVGDLGSLERASAGKAPLSR